MASRGLSVLYWTENYPILLSSMAAMTPGMTPHEVAEILDDMDYEIIHEATEQGECIDLSDGALISQYMALI